MGTSNFYYRNTSKIYAVCMSYEDDVLDDEGNPTGEKETRNCEEFEVDDEICYIKEILSENPYFQKDYGHDNHNNRNFPSWVLGTFSAQKQYGRNDIEVKITCVMRSGYYEGACLDYNIEYISGTSGGDEEIDPESVKSDFMWYGTNPGIGAMHASKAVRWAENKKDEICTFIEQKYEEISMPLRVIARASNGETWYEKAS
jgi:hypothetical protein